MTIASIQQYYASSTTDAMDRFKDMAVSAGWSLHDDLSGSTPYSYVLTSSGSAGMDMPCYLKLEKGTNSIRVMNYIYWDASSHTGYIRCGGSETYSYIQTYDSSSFYINGSANEDGIAVTSLYSNTHQLSWVGLINPLAPEPALGVAQSSVTAGSDVVLTVASGEAGTFSEDASYQIVDNNSFETVTVTTVNESTNELTLDSLSNGISAGGRIGVLPYRWANYCSRVNYAWVLRYDRSGTTCGNYENITPLSIYLPGNVDPDQRSNRYIMWPFCFQEATNICIAGWQYADDKAVFLRCYVSTSKELPITVGNKDSGTSTGSNSSTILNDTNKSWTTNEFQGKVLSIAAGPGAGQFRTISSNTATSITVPAFDTIPDDTSEYAIAEEGWQYLYIQNSNNSSGAIRIL